MADSPKKIPVRNELRPSYYDKFHCLAANCRYSCCKYWRISFDKKDYLALKRQTGTPELNQRMEHGLRRIRDNSLPASQYAEFTLKDGVCPLLREDCLCHLQVEKGPDALPWVCKVFPRTELYLLSGFLERSLSPACEGVLDLLWNLPEGVDFVSDPLPREKWKNASWEVDNPLFQQFHAIRSLCIDFLQDRRFPLPDRILRMGLALKDLADGETDLPRWLEKAAALLAGADVAMPLPSGDSAEALFLSNNLKVMLALRSADRDVLAAWTEILNALGMKIQAGTTLATLPYAPYRACRERYQERFGDRDYFMENLMVSLFFHLHLPDSSGPEGLWKSYVNFCSLYSFYRFVSVMSCREGTEESGRDELFRMLVHANRLLIHNSQRQAELRDEFFQHDSATLAHMAILLCG